VRVCELAELRLLANLSSCSFAAAYYIFPGSNGALQTIPNYLEPEELGKPASPGWKYIKLIKDI